MKNSNPEIHLENDKIYCPYLLGCSYSSLIKFEGSYLQNNILYFKFSPRSKALELIDQLQTKTEPRIPAKDLFDAISAFWKKISASRNEEINNGRNKR